MADYIIYSFSDLTTKLTEITKSEKYSAMDNPKCIYISWSTISRTILVTTHFDIDSVPFMVECVRVAENYKDYLNDMLSVCKGKDKLARRQELRKRLDTLDYFLINFLNSELPY